MAQLNKELGQENMSKLHSTLLKLGRDFVDSSRNVMCQYYSEWDAAFKMYDATAPDRVKSKKSSEHEGIDAQSVPLTFGQVDTWRAFASQFFDQRDLFFELKAVGAEDEKYRRLAEQLLQQNMVAEQYTIKRDQFLSAIAITNLGVFKSSWVEKKMSVMVEAETEQRAFNQDWGKVKEKAEKTITTFKGTQIENLSPYRFFPDPAVSISEFQKGRFVASEHEFSRHELLLLEKQGKVHGIKHVGKKFSNTRWEKREKHSRLNGYKHEDRNNEVIVVTEIQVKIVPSQFKTSDNQPLGKANHEMILNLWIANDQRVIKAEIMSYLHNKFTYDVGTFDPEIHKYLRKSIVAISRELQETLDWFLNSRVESVTQNIEKPIIVDPIGVDIEKIANRQRIIPLKRGASRGGIDRMVKQLDTSDPTTGHLNDMQALYSFMQAATGINANMLGQYSSGRRSATEARVVASGSSARAINTLKNIHAMALGPLASKCLSNLRQGYTPEDVKRYAGKHQGNLVSLFLASPEEIASSVDLFIVESTTPSEKAFIAQSLQETFGIVVNNPEQAASLDLSPKLILNKILELRGVAFKEDMALSNDDQTLNKMIEEKAMAMAQQIILQMQEQAKQQEGQV